MAEEHGFKATEKMYKSRIKMWRLDKKNKMHEVKEILRQRAKRKSIGKKTGVILRDHLVDLRDIERYAKRKGLAFYPENHSPDGSSVPDLVIFTPPPTPLPLECPDSLQNTERFLHSFNTFVKDSLQSGLWTLGKDVMGFACILGVEYPTSARDRFFLSVERGVRRYNLGDISQAYRQWRAAFEDLQFVVQARRPSQLLCLVELVSHLAECKDEVATLMLRYLGDLVNKHASHDARLSMLQSLSRLQAEDLTGLTAASYNCSRHAFSGHFRRKSFFLLDSETILMDSKDESEGAAISALSDLVLDRETYDVEALRAARSVMEMLMASERYKEAELIANIHIQRMHEMEYDGVVGGAFSHAYSYLTHLYLMTQDYEKAYHFTQLKVENYFHVLECRHDLPEDFILSSYSLLSSLAQRLGIDKEAEKWKREHTILKRRTDALAESELLDLKSRAHPNVQDRANSEIFSGISVEDFRKCNCHALEQPNHKPRRFNPEADFVNVTSELPDKNQELPIRSLTSSAEEQLHPDMLLPYTEKRSSQYGGHIPQATGDESKPPPEPYDNGNFSTSTSSKAYLPIVPGCGDHEHISPYPHDKALAGDWRRWISNIGLWSQACNDQTL
ncbi:hypothetical protein H2200_009975 [Cladophialophora chaetospira]|uniref:Clr5 domain-containing protein n=1 Tax=Cladophialophora chaetospira TaxID=386627 RepID=A0AA39CEH1_9EURO|nr:hypothetical protein H2200_009975 [Cladophialophora chaetospira]